MGEVNDRAATHEKTDSRGVARLDVLEGVHYKIEAKIWAGREDVVRSGITDLTQGQVPLHLKFVLSQYEGPLTRSSRAVSGSNHLSRCPYGTVLISITSSTRRLACHCWKRNSGSLSVLRYFGNACP